MRFKTLTSGLADARVRTTVLCGVVKRKDGEERRKEKNRGEETTGREHQLWTLESVALLFIQQKNSKVTRPVFKRKKKREKRKRRRRKEMLRDEVVAQ